MVEKEYQFDEKAVETGKKLFGNDGVIKIFRDLSDWDPEFSMLVQKFGWAGMYSRTILDDRTRELCAVAALTVLGRLPQLETHIKFALRSQATRVEVLEVILQMCIYGGFPVMYDALKVLKKVYTELGE